MSRLFVTPRDIDYINDIAKEMLHDIVGTKIHYYSISREKTRIHDVYDESLDKIFEDPIQISAFIDWQPSDVHATEFGTERVRVIKAYISSRDLISRNINVNEGDFIGFGIQFFEIVKSVGMRLIYGQVEYTDGIELVCREARQDQFVTKVIGPKGESFSDDDAIQKTFVQQRGFEDNIEGPTGDVRDLQRRGVLDEPISGPREVSEKGDDKESSSFYDE